MKYIFIQPSCLFRKVENIFWLKNSFLYMRIVKSTVQFIYLFFVVVKSLNKQLKVQSEKKHNVLGLKEIVQL